MAKKKHIQQVVFDRFDELETELVDLAAFLEVATAEGNLELMVKYGRELEETAQWLLTWHKLKSLYWNG